MPGLLCTTNQVGSLMSEISTSSEAGISSPPSPISSEEQGPKPLPEPSQKLSSNTVAAIQLLQNRHKCILKDPWNTSQLLPGEYEELWRYLEREEGDLLAYIEDKVHLDYDPKTFEFAVRMPLARHDHLGRSIEKSIELQLDIIRNGNDPIALIAQNIRNFGSTSIFFQDGTRHDPDGQFAYKGAKWPTFIIEVANSQSKKDGGKDLPKLADSYICESKGNVSTVLGVFLDYRGTKMATFSIWRPSYGVDEEGEFLSAGNTTVSHKFRNPDGTGVTGQNLRLPLHYFLPPSVVLPPEMGEREIIISCEDLAQDLKEAELREGDSGTGTELVLPPGTRIRKREETPPETLRLADERRFALEEREAERLASEEDEDREDT